VTDNTNLFRLIKQTVVNADPGAKVILFGSYARGDYHEDSDIDLLILLDKEKITYDDRAKITFPLFMVEVNSSIQISPLLYSRKFWESGHKATPFYESVNEEGIEL